jgi:hypothetical protein
MTDAATRDYADFIQAVAAKKREMAGKRLVLAAGFL